MATDQLINKSQGDAIISGLTAIKNAINDQPVPTQVEDVVADAFDVGVSYVPGDYCIYENKLYKCDVAHHGAWDGNDFTLTTVGAELESLSEALNSSGEMVSLGASASSTHISIAFDETQYKRLGLSVSRGGFTYAYTEVDYQWFKANKTTAATGLGATHYASSISTQLAAESFYNTSTGKVEIWVSANGQCSVELFGIK